jgi:hypothetical protein
MTIVSNDIGPDVTPLADQPSDMPWVASITMAATSGAVRTLPDVATVDARTAADFYDPTAETVATTFNEFGFITSPSPAPVDPRTGAVPMTNIEVCHWVGHLQPVDGVCPRCGTTIG